MTTAALEPTLACLTDWSDQRQQYEADLQESFDALDAYQRQLDAWQRRLAAEREQLEQERVRLQQQAEATSVAAEQNDQTIALEAELNASRQCADELRAQIAEGESARTRLQTENDRFAAEAQQNRESQQNAERQLEDSRAELARQSQHWSSEFARVVKLLEEQQAANASTPGPIEAAATGGVPAATGDPVLGSVVAQFSKLRQQRAERGLR